MHILFEDGLWRIKCGHCQGQDVKRTRDESIEFARQHVGWYPQGTIAKILVRNEGGGTEVVWKYGEDPFPGPQEIPTDV